MSQRLNYDAEQLLLNGVRETAVRFASKSIEPEHLLLAILEKYKLKECFDSDRSRQKLTETLKKSLEAICSDEAEHSVPLPPSPRYLEFLSHILFSDLPNTPAFPSDNKGRMEKEWVASLKYVASENPGTQTAALITEFLGNIKASDNKLSPSYETTLLRKLALPSFPETK